MGRCLQWLDETGEGWAKACLDGELARACARKSGPRDEEIAAAGRWKAFPWPLFPGNPGSKLRH
jgi:hypothetical protein